MILHHLNALLLFFSILLEEVVEIVVGLLIALDFIPYIFNVENKLFVSIVYIMFILLKCSYMVAHIFVCYDVKMEVKGVIQILSVGKSSTACCTTWT